MPRGTDIEAEAAGDQSGSAVSLSADGAVLAVGGPRNDGTGDSAGHVRVYAWGGSSWTQRGDDLDGEAGSDLSGSKGGVSLSADGSVLAIGAPDNDGAGVNDAGHVRVYEWDDTDWVRRGNDIDGENANDESGGAVSLSADGAVLAIGALRHDSFTGHVRVVAWSLSPASSSPATPTAGDDPIFVGADGLEFEVLGEVGAAFNLLSSPALSLNAEFIGVPRAFRGAHAGDLSRTLTNTTLGSVHLAACAEGRAMGLRLDVASGKLRCSLGGGEGGAAFCAKAAKAIGMVLTEERHACLLDRMRCGYYPAGANAASEMPRTMSAALSHPSLVHLGLRRVNVSFGGVALSIVRDSVEGPVAQLGSGSVDCGALEPWTRAVKACELLKRSSETQADRDAWFALDANTRIATLVALARGRPENAFHFANVRADGVELPQAQVHGLLGQRAKAPKAYVASVAPNGEAQSHQGEGYIEGTYDEYKVASVETHGAWRYARLGCATS